jgi:hypothetical protein
MKEHCTMNGSLQLTFTLPAAVHKVATTAAETPDADFPAKHTGDGSMVDTLGAYKVTLFEAVALTLYERLNGGSWERTPQTCTVWTLRTIGPGFRGAEQLTDLVVLVLGLAVTPRVLCQHGLTREDGPGNFLAWSTLILWFIMALYLWLTRTVGRKKEEVPLQSPKFPWVLVNDQMPDPKSKHYFKTTLALMLYNLFIFALTVLSVYTLITQTYAGKNRVFGTLLAIRTCYMVLGCIEDWTQMHAVNGFPRGPPRQLMAQRATVWMSATAIFTGVLIAASPSWW